MAFSAESIKPPLQEQTTELKRKIQLLESDRATYYESTQSSIKKNKQSILQLRQQNKELRRRLAEANAGDEQIIKVAFHNRGVEKNAYRNLSTQEAATTLDHRVMSKRKRLNALKATTQTNQRRLEELNMKYRRLKSEGSGGTASADIRNLKEEEDAMDLLVLDNRLEKTQLNGKEAKNIMSHYLNAKSRLQDESLTFEGQLDSLEAEILKHREEHQKLQVINNDAQLSRKATEAGLQQLEESLFKERKERERLKTSYTKKAEELKAQAEKADRRVQRTIIQPDELSSEAPHSTTRMAGEEEKVMSTFEEAFRRNKEAAEVTDSQEIVDPITSQGETRQHLEKLKKENEEVLVQLKQQKELLNQDFENIKYSGGVKFSSDQQTLEECEQQLQAEQQRCNAGKERLHGLVKAFSTARPAVEHLIDKLQHITVSEDTVAGVHPDSDVYVVELMTQLELKLQVLQQELQGKDLAAIKKEMEEEEFHVRIEDKLPEYNTRVRLPEDEAADLFTDEDASGESEANIISREALKRQSKLIADANFKRKPWKKKKGKF
ncbi:coiled-coil domain-containing protein 151-like [Stegastes partitus]|uniref:Coiled-coil domain-containing protein 151-like n=1 Tax=Stegastes partitus TaxID=144197 RepID=A0A9Y4K3G4_9TELE|nr:PREDICTED: coiled-coil domain-containing protein 151-like [Stegastes partitus]